MPENISAIDLVNQELEMRRSFPAVIHNTLFRYNRYVGKSKGNLLTKQEMKIFLYALTFIKPGDTELKPITFNIKEFGQVCGIDLGEGSYYAQIKDSVSRLGSRNMWLIKPDKSEELVHLIKKATIPPGKGEITICFDEELSPYLLGLTNDYSKFAPHDWCCMKSQYGIWLWMVLSCFSYHRHHIEQITFEIDEFKEFMDCTNYKKISHLKEKVIEPAVRDINAYTPIRITDVTYLKNGRSIKYVTFHIEDLLKTDPDEYQTRRLNTAVEIAGNLNQ